MKKVLFYIMCGPLGIIAAILNIVWTLVVLAMRPIYKLFKYEDSWNHCCQHNEEVYDDFWDDLEF